MPKRGKVALIKIIVRSYLSHDLDDATLVFFIKNKLDGSIGKILKSLLDKDFNSLKSTRK